MTNEKPERKEIGNLVPDQRLGQLLENYVFGHHTDGCIFHVEDNITEKNIDLELGEG
tara:strand:+ start:1965 stop:2135 length:171 start_codon:yes stop_codon:yes gene_type:complete